MTKLIDYAAKFRTATHFIVAGVITAAAWVIANPQIVDPIVSKFHKAAVITTAATMILALYHNSKA